MKTVHAVVIGFAVLTVLLVTAYACEDVDAEDIDDRIDNDFASYYKVEIVVDEEVIMHGGLINSDSMCFTHPCFISSTPITVTNLSNGIVKLHTSSDIVYLMDVPSGVSLGTDVVIGVKTIWHTYESMSMGYGTNLHDEDVVTTSSKDRFLVNMKYGEMETYELKYNGLPNGLLYPTTYGYDDNFQLGWLDDQPGKKFRGWIVDFDTRADFELPVRTVTFDGRYASDAVVTAVWTPVNADGTDAVQLPPAQAEPPAPVLMQQPGVSPTPEESDAYVPVLAGCSIAAVFLCAVVALKHRF